MSRPLTAIDWATADIASNPRVAHPGSDFVAATGTLTFLPGETSKAVAVEILGHLVDEPPLLRRVGSRRVSDPAYASLDVATFFGLGLFIIIDDD